MAVELSNKMIGIVKKQNNGIGDRPVIEIIEENGQRISNPYQHDLSEKLDIVITNCAIG